MSVFTVEEDGQVKEKKNYNPFGKELLRLLELRRATLGSLARYLKVADQQLYRSIVSGPRIKIHFEWIPKIGEFLGIVPITLLITLLGKEKELEAKVHWLITVFLQLSEYDQHTIVCIADQLLKNGKKDPNYPKLSMEACAMLERCVLTLPIPVEELILPEEPLVL